MTVTDLTNQTGVDDEGLALDTLRAVCQDPNAPAAARAGAARTILEARQVIGRHAAQGSDLSDKPLSALSRDELEAELRALNQPKR
jgi:hypothetical protein